MNNPLSDLQFGQMRHQEMEAEVSYRWGRSTDAWGNPRVKKTTLMAMSLFGSAIVIALTMMVL